MRDGEPKLELKMVATKLGSFEHPRETDALTLTQPDLEGLLAGTDIRDDGRQRAAEFGRLRQGDVGAEGKAE